MDKTIATDDVVVIALGSNLAGGHASIEALLEAAVGRLPDAGLRVLARSRWWRSAAWPDPTKPDYLNGVALVETRLSPRETLAALLGIEQAFGRRRGETNAPRTLDLDLIAHGRAVVDEPGLILPHPRAAERRFVMGPLAEIAPDWRHPVNGECAAALHAAADVGADAAPAWPVVEGGRGGP
jgi:2-amino-4-hydroxy-6-hydroxymethyldihydropteridine diphosphokinase